MRQDLLAAAVAACFAGNALSNPTGAHVVQGTVSMSNPSAGVLQIVNSPSSIINWQKFSIGQGELTQFLQQSAASAVLNRVVTNDPSSILGTLQSNGRVFLINPNGIVFGHGSVVDVAGMVASSLNISDDSFRNGKLIFDPTPGAGAVVNNGFVSTGGQGAGGHVYLVGPAVTNGGLINTPQGATVLAAGESVELVSPWTPDLSVKVTAAGNEALNLGQIFSDSGKVGIYAGLIQQQGTVSANTVVAGEDGSIRLVATGATTFAAGSSTTGGRLDIDSGDLTVAGSVYGGPQNVNVTGALVVANEQPSGFASLTASGGQAISARSLEVTAKDGGYAAINNMGSGNQTITVAGGGSSPGIDVRVLSTGGTANLGNYAEGALQTITVTDADHINVNAIGDAGIAFPGAFVVGYHGTQTISITGTGANAINIGSAGAQSRSIFEASSQVITAGQGTESGSITIIGSDGNSSFAGITSQPVGAPNGVQTVSTSGTLSVIAGDAPAKLAGQATAVAHNTSGPQTVSADRIVVRGGSSGSGNRANIGVQFGPQTINVGAGGIEMTGGGDGTGNQALMFAGTGPQTITTSSAILTAGAGGAGNYAVIVAPVQDMTVSGDLVLNGGGSVPTPAAGGGALIGGGTSLPTNLKLAVGGSVTLNGGYAVDAGAALGTGLTGIQRTDITMNVGGDITLNPGAVTGTRIGSRPENMAGGEIFINAGGTIALNSAGPGRAGAIRTLDGVHLTANQIVQGPDAQIQANSLEIDTQQGASLIGANMVNTFNATNWFGDVAFHNGSPLLTVTGVDVAGSSLILEQAGNLLISGPVVSGPQSIDVTGSLSVTAEAVSAGWLSAFGGQSISARAMDVTAQDDASAFVTNSGSGDQSITIAGGGASSGLDVRTLSGLGVAQIRNDAPGAMQTIRVTDADHIFINGMGSGGAGMYAVLGSQVISITGTGANALTFGSADALGFSQIGAGNQSVTAGLPGQLGSITIVGSDGNSRLAGMVSQPGIGNYQTVSTSGALVVKGGGASAQPSNFPAGIFHNGTGQQTINAQSILIQGGATGSGNSSQVSANNGSQLIDAGAGGLIMRGGASGVNNFAMFSQFSTDPAFTQTVTSTGPVLLEGGSGNFTFAMIRAFGGHQELSFGDTTLLAGAGGIDNFSNIQARSQDMTVHGDLELMARGSAGTPTIGGGARIGGTGGASPSSTDLRLNVDGDLTMTAGSLAGTGVLLGNSTIFTGNTDIDVNVGGNIAMNGGSVPGTFATIGSRAASPAGGNIELQAGGVMALNSTSPDQASIIRTLDGVTLTAQSITQGPDSRIEAGSLTVETAQGASLGGANSVSQLSMLNAASGAIDFNNTSALLTVTGIDQVKHGTLNLDQAGDLRITGDVTSGAQSIDATGDMTVTPGEGPNVTMEAKGAQTFNVGGSFSLLGGSAWDGYAVASATGTQRITTGGDLVVRGGSGLLAAGLIYGKDDVHLTVGNELRLDGGTGLLAFARVQADFGDRIFLSFPNRASGGYFVDGREGVASRGLDGFFTGLLPARGRSLVLTYGQ